MADTPIYFYETEIEWKGDKDLQIASGKSLREITGSTRSVAEGVRNTRSLCSLARCLGVEMPIVEQMFAVLYGGKKPADAVRELMQRSLKPEAG